MSSAWRKTLVYLGLVEEAEEHDELPERFHDRPSEPSPDDVWHGRERDATVRPLRVPESGPAHVRAMNGGEVAAVTIVEVRDFDDAEQIGASYRSGHPVLFDLGRVDTKTGRRVLDFVSGVTYALRGRLSSAGGRAFLLVPAGAELTSEERRRLAELGYAGVAQRSEG